MTLQLTKQERSMGWLYTAVQQLALPAALSLVCAIVGITSNAVANFIFYCINFGCWVLIFKRPLLESFRNTQRLPAAMGRGLAIYYLGSTLVNALVVILDPAFANANDANVASMVREFPPLAFATVFLVPVAEECLFRGLLFLPFAQKRPRVGYALSMICFSVVHLTAYLRLLDGAALVLSFLQYLPAGLALCYACVYADSLAAPILMHTCINALAVITTR